MERDGATALAGRRPAALFAGTFVAALPILVGLWIAEPQLAFQSNAITGQVVDGSSRAPIAKARVTLSGAASGAATRAAVTDIDGRFEFAQVTGGRFWLEANAPGYAAGRFPETIAGGFPAPLDVRAGAGLSEVVLTLWKHAGIAGWVVDHLGEPAVKVRVVALRRTSIGGDVRLTEARSDVTDDRGEYRITGLVPGDFLLAVPSEPVARRLPTDPPTVFYPSAPTSAEATVLSLQPGMMFHGAGIALNAGTAERTISGRIAGGVDLPDRLSVRLRPAQAVDDLDAQEAMTGPDRSFHFERVRRGLYELFVSIVPQPGLRDGGASVRFIEMPRGPLKPTPKDDTWWGSAAVEVGDEDPAPVVVVLQPASRIAGRVVFDGVSPRPGNPESMFVAVVPAHGRDLSRFPLAPIEPDGRFVTVGLPPGRYELTPWFLAEGWQAWSLRSVLGGGQEFAGRPVTVGPDALDDVRVVLTDRPSVLVGRVVTAQGKAAVSAPVYVFPLDAAFRHRLIWAPSRFATARTTASGTFTVPQILPGDYLVSARSVDGPADWASPESLAQLSADAERVRVQTGETRSVTLTIR